MIETIQLPNARAEMTHRLLPSIDGMLKLSRLLVENDGNRLSPRQIDYAQTLYSSATELWLAMGKMAGQAGSGLAGRTLLLVASDMRAIYALTGALEDQGMQIVHATDADELDAALENDVEFDGVLLDGEDKQFDSARLMHRLCADDVSIPVISMNGAGKYVEPAKVWQLIAKLRERLDRAARC